MTLVLFVIIKSALAFSGKNHHKIGETVVNHYVFKNYPLGDKEKNAFAKGCKFEDYLRMLPIKALNQHFYLSGKELEHKRHFLRRIKLYCSELNRFKKSHDTLAFWFTAGRITHYFQDMACPPHVTPIYHKGGDKFDGIVLDTLVLALTDIYGSNIPSLSKKSLLDLLDYYAKRTEDSIQDTLTIFIDGKKVEVTWEYFWKKNVNNTKPKYFGSYGIVGNNFGTTNFAIKKTKNNSSSTNESIQYKVEKSEYDTFQNKRIVQALEATAVILQFSYNLLHS